MKQQFTGRSVAEASIKACEALGLTRSQLKHDVVSQTGEALARKVIISVEVGQNVEIASSPSLHTQSSENDFIAHEPASTKERAPRRSRSHVAPVEPLSDEIATPAGPAMSARTRVVDGPSRSAEGGRRTGQEMRGRDEGPRRSRGRPAATSPREPRSPRAETHERPPARQPRGSESHHSSSGETPRRRSSAGGQEANGIDALLQMHGHSAGELTPRPVIQATHPAAGSALKMVQDLLTHMDLDLRAQLVQESDEELHIDLAGKDENRAIGRKGEVLLALQFIAGRMLNRSPSDQIPMLVLDAGGYRERRRQALAALAQTLAERAIEERKAVRLSPMSAHDRRIFHVTLKEIAGITSRSEGDGAFRSLLIVPSEFT